MKKEKPNLRPGRFLSAGKCFRRAASAWTMAALMCAALLMNACSDDDTDPGYPMLPAKEFAAAAGNGQVVLTWTAPQSDYVKEYSVTWSPGNGSATVKTGLSYTATGLDNGTEYTFTLYAVYDTGKSDPVTAKATPQNDAINYEPCADLQAAGGDRSIELTWKTPKPMSDAELAGYTISVMPREIDPVKVSDPAATTHTLTGLTNGTTYTVSIVADYKDGKQSAPVSAKAKPEAPDLNVYIDFDLVNKKVNQMKATQTGEHEFELVTQGGDPYLSTKNLEEDNPADSVVLTFEYKAGRAINNVQIFFGAPISEARSITGLTIPASSGSNWGTWSVVLKKQIAEFNWGSAGDYMRFDIGQESGYTLNIRKIRFRGMNDEELRQWQEEQEQQQSALAFENGLKDYLSKNYSCRVTHVKATASEITVTGSYTGEGSFSLSEIPVYDDVTKLTKHKYKTALTENSFRVTLPRYVSRNGFEYDRTLSKWAVVKEGNDRDELMSHARYADEIEASQNLPKMTLKSKKGLGGFHMNSYVQDLDDLGITSVTVNVDFPVAMYTRSQGACYEHTYGGKTFYFEKGYFDRLDNALKLCNEKGIVTAAIILIPPSVSDPEITRMLRHPDYRSPGIFTMPNMTNAESVNCYAAGLDFLAKRYCQNGSPNGRINHWILHNEVDAGDEWTNMGDKMVTTFTDTYIKSMRMCYDIARQYDPNTEVLASFTHSWTTPSSHGYKSLDIINLLNDYTKAEGDYQWGLAYHPYPQDLNEPKTWLDRQATYSMNTPYVTFKNLEVLDKWAMDRANWYRNGAIKRTVWLSENGTNSRTYSEKDLAEQAAGFAWAWKKIKVLDGIDGIQWHNWIDNPGEYGLRIGLRKFPSPDNGAPKPVWYLYQAAGTASEDEVFDQYKALETIQQTMPSVTDWNIIQPVN